MFLLTQKNDVINTATATIDYLRLIDFKGSIYCIGTKCFKDQLTDAGFDLIEDVRNVAI